jgi:predicted AAA+ superfamily ATPase
MQLSELVHDLNPSWRSASLRSRANLLPRREMHGRLLEHLSRNARRAAVLVGPRQVGKTTLLRQLGDALLDGGVPAANITYFDFSDDRLPEAGISPRDVIAVRPEGFQADAPRFFLFDEVSRATRWADWLKHAVDAGEGRIVVTDSAAALLRQSGRESGQGRWDEFHLETLSLREFVALQALPREAFETTLQRLGRPLDRYLSVGGYPEHITANSLAEARRRIRADTVERAILRDLLRMDVDVERVRELFVYLLEDSGAIFDAGARQRLLDRPGAVRARCHREAEGAGLSKTVCGGSRTGGRIQQRRRSARGRKNLRHGA